MTLKSIGRKKVLVAFFFQLVRYLNKHELGRCKICGRRTLFLVEKDNLKESLKCVHCRAWLRLRFIAEQLIELFSQSHAESLSDLVKEEGVRSLKIYSAQASGPIHNVLKNCPGYVCSEYFDLVPSGKIIDGVLCENLQELSFPDDEFDLVMHTAVLEHVRKPEQVLNECHRVIKPGGYLLFEVPMTDPWAENARPRTIHRVDTSGDEDKFILEPIYHNDPIRSGGALVYTDFGMDVSNLLTDIGFRVEVKQRALARSRVGRIVVFICQK